MVAEINSVKKKVKMKLKKYFRNEQRDVWKIEGEDKKTRRPIQEILHSS